MEYLRRSIEPVVRDAVAHFPAVVLTGPRQSGKTTLLKKLFGNTYRYVSLDEPDTRQAAIDDPRAFLQLNQPPLILDEAQYAPDLFHYLRALIDENRENRGQYILTGSQNFQFLEKIGESLAGRAAILNLLPFSTHELLNRVDRKPFWEREAPQDSEQSFDSWDYILKGSYPEVATGQQSSWELWHESYLQTYIERDVRSLKGIRDLAKFQDFVRALAVRSGTILNYTEIANTLDIGVTTVREWISVLQAAYQIVILQPWFTNINKQLRKSPKIYLADTGQMCSLLNLRTVDELRRSEYVGQVFETAVVNEIRKTIVHQGRRPQLNFWRTKAGTEVDLLIHQGDTIVPVEIKSTSTPKSDLTSSLNQFRTDFQKQVKQSYLVYAGDKALPMKQQILAVPFSML